MLESCTTSQERWGGVHQLIDRWLAERKQLVLEYTTLRDRPAPDQHPDRILESFCDILVDYTSAGHFEIYEQLIREAEDFNDEGALALIKQVYPRIETITRTAVAFNDRFGDAATLAEETELQSELRQLGGLLHERFELEDCLIEVLHTAHKQAAAPA